MDDVSSLPGVSGSEKLSLSHCLHRKRKKLNNVEPPDAFVLTPFFLQPFLHSGMHISLERQQ